MKKIRERKDTGKEKRLVWMSGCEPTQQQQQQQHNYVQNAAKQPSMTMAPPMMTTMTGQLSAQSCNSSPAATNTRTAQQRQPQQHRRSAKANMQSSLAVQRPKESGGFAAAPRTKCSEAQHGQQPRQQYLDAGTAGMVDGSARRGPSSAMHL